jgi:hypothetical protein
MSWQLCVHFSSAKTLSLRHMNSFRWKSLRYTWLNFKCIIVMKVNLSMILNKDLMFLFSDVTLNISYLDVFFLKFVHWFFHWVSDFLFTSLTRKSIDIEIFSTLNRVWASLACLFASSFSRMFLCYDISWIESWNRVFLNIRRFFVCRSMFLFWTCWECIVMLICYRQRREFLIDNSIFEWCFWFI